jgi:pyruvate/2-oxoglutarate dehydrogenase complex dihydrolipoamide acyltransferase (E2) component
MRGRRSTGWRRIAAALWSSPGDPQIFGALEVDAAPIRAFLDAARQAGRHLTPTHLVGRAIAHALQAVPEINVQLRGGRLIPRDGIDIFFIVAVAAGQDLSGVKVANVDQRSAVEVADELSGRGRRLKAGSDPDFARTKQLMNALPPRLLRLVMRASAFVTNDLRREVPALGLRRTPFGSAMVSSVGMLGLPHGFAPLAWMYDVPLLVLVAEITPRPAVVDGLVVARDVLPITATIDHRYVDGFHVSRLMAAFRAYLADPARHEPALTPPP